MDLNAFPRRIYTPYHTPIEQLPRLSQALGGKVHLWVKRDDQLGLAGGGNKTRKLEFVMADALLKDADVLITCGAVQSNHCRLTLAACVREGLPCYLVLEERVPGSYNEEASGNNYLYRLLGAHVILVANGEAPAAMQKLAAELKASGQYKRPYICPGGASNEVGAKGYAACAQEIVAQCYAQQLPRFHAIVAASGSGGTHAGLVVGMTALRCPTPVVGISTRHPAEKQRADILGLCTRLSSAIGVPAPPEAAVTVLDQYVGAGYSLPTDGMVEAVAMFARFEGILLDPVYSGKVAAGLIDQVRKGAFPEGSHVLFLHTGGAPSLYHYQPLPRSKL